MTFSEKAAKEMEARQYAEVRVHANEEEKKELNQAEAGYDFSISTGIIFLTIGAFYMFSHQIIFHWINISLLSLSIIFFIGARVERRDVYSPLYFALIEKYDID